MKCKVKAILCTVATVIVACLLIYLIILGLTSRIGGRILLVVMLLAEGALLTYSTYDLWRDYWKWRSDK